MLLEYRQKVELSQHCKAMSSMCIIMHSITPKLKILEEKRICTSNQLFIKYFITKHMYIRGFKGNLSGIKDCLHNHPDRVHANSLKYAAIPHLVLP